MAPRIYKSPYPDRPIVQHSLYAHLFPENAKHPAHLPAYVDAASGATLIRSQVEDLALRFAQGVITKKSAKRGDTLMLFSPNSLCWPVVVFGALAAGLRITFANVSYTPDELKHQYTDSQAYLICTTRGNLKPVIKMLQAVAPSVAEAERRVIILPDDFNWIPDAPRTKAMKPIPRLTALDELLGLGKLERVERFDGVDAEQETAFLCYSSGTTGKPKGVQTTHQNLTTVLDIVYVGFPVITPKDDRMLAVLPFYHIYGLVKLLLYPFMCGVTTIVMEHFDPIKFCQSVERYKATISLIVPPVLVIMARHDCVKQYDMSSLRVLFSGAAPLGGDLVKAVKKRLRPTNEPPLYIVQGYGLTETSPTTHLQNLKDESRFGCIGDLLPNLEVRLVVDDRDGMAKTDDEVVDAKEGEPGEIWIRGPSIMKGYLNNPTANSNSFYPYSSPPPSKYVPGSLWFKTGDVGLVDRDGYFWIVDRKKELIKYKGFQVPPAELESVLLAHPNIADAAVISVESARESTELPRAYIVPADPPSDPVTFGREVQAWIKTKVARHKFLRGGVIVVEVIPKSASGKILRRHLKNQALKELGGKDPAEDMDADKARSKL